MTYESMKSRVHFRLNALRTIERILDDNKEHMTKIFKDVSGDHDDAIDAVNNFNPSKLKRIIRQGTKALSEWSYRELRTKACKLNVPNWSRLNKGDLILEVGKYEQKRNN